MANRSTRSSSSSIALGGTVAGVLADTPRARVWVVATSGEMVAFDVADGLRPAGLRRWLVARRTGGDRRHRPAGRCISSPGNVALRARRRGPRSDAAKVAAPEVLPSIGVLRFGSGVASSETMPAVAVPIVVIDAPARLRSHWMPPDAVAVTAGPPVVQSTIAGIRVAMELDARCGAVACAGADPLMGTLRAEVQLAEFVARAGCSRATTAGSSRPSSTAWSRTGPTRWPCRSQTHSAIAAASTTTR